MYYETLIWLIPTSIAAGILIATGFQIACALVHLFVETVNNWIENYDYEQDRNT